MKKTSIGGQAVMEGVMMKNMDRYAIAVRKPNHEIVVDVKDYVSFGEKHKICRLPILRGVVNFVESMVIGMKTLTYSASFFEEEEEVKPSKFDNMVERIFKEKTTDVFMGVTVAISILLAVGIFMILPYLLVNIFKNFIDSYMTLAIIEGVVRISIFLLYILLISRLKDIQRVFMYHGAEHKTINCLEAGEPLTPENIRKHTRLHKRCGTSFLLIVMVVSIIFFMFIKVDGVGMRILVRLLLVPIIAGVSYEFIRLAGKSESALVVFLSKPGMMLQKLTTREPDDEMLEVAIKSVEGVLDWQEYIDALNNNTLEV